MITFGFILLAVASLGGKWFQSLNYTNIWFGLLSFRIPVGLRKSTKMEPKIRWSNCWRIWFGYPSSSLSSILTNTRLPHLWWIHHWKRLGPICRSLFGVSKFIKIISLICAFEIFMGRSTSFKYLKIDAI